MGKYTKVGSKKIKSNGKLNQKTIRTLVKVFGSQKITTILLEKAKENSLQ